MPSCGPYLHFFYTGIVLVNNVSVHTAAIKPGLAKDTCAHYYSGYNKVQFFFYEINV